MNFIGRNLFRTAVMFLVIIEGESYAHVYDLDPIPPDKVYSLERSVFERNNSEWYRDFPSFEEWLGERERKEERFKEWVSRVAYEIAIEFAELVDPNGLYTDRAYRDLREGAAAEPPCATWQKERD